MDFKSFAKLTYFWQNVILIRIYFNFLITFTVLDTLKSPLPHSSNKKKTDSSLRMTLQNPMFFNKSTALPSMGMLYPPNFWHHQARVNKKTSNSLFCSFWAAVFHLQVNTPLNCISIIFHDSCITWNLYQNV